MNKKLYWLIPTLLLALGGLTCLAAGPLARRPVQTARPPAAMQIGTPTIGTIVSTPSLITVNTSTPVTVTAQITDSRVIPAGVNLLRLNATGTPPTVLGVMRDDGTNGDAVANDKAFSLRVNFNEPTAGQIQLQVSAAFTGILRRTTSPILSVIVGTVLTVPAYSISVIVPPLWKTTISTSQAEGDPTPSNIVLSSPGGSVLAILPEGGEGFDLTDNVGENRQALSVGKYAATRREFYYADGEIFLVTIVVHGVINRPVFRIDIEPKTTADLRLADTILASLTLP